jgi:4,5-dihydroxyphthalate decarboxylase
MVVPPGSWSRAVVDGTVTVPGMSWECVSDIGRTPGRFMATKQCDVGENGIRHLALNALKGAPPVAIPVFFTREHMQRNIIVRDDSSLSHPGELAGKRVGSPLTIISGTAIGVMVLLEQAYGARLTDIEWHSGNPDPLVNNRMGLTLKRGPREVGENLDRLLRGELDAVIVTTGPRYWSMFGDDKLDQLLASRSGLRSLVSEPDMIAATYKRTGLYPITDIAVVGADIPRLHPELPAQLVEVFSQANDLAPRYRSTKEEALARREIELLGEDPHRYGLGENPRRNLAALLDLLARLGALERAVEPEELFVPSTRGS